MSATSSSNGSELEYLKNLVSQVSVNNPRLAQPRLAQTDLQLQGKITQLEGSAMSTAKEAVASVKQAVGAAPTEQAPRLVLIGPPGAGMSLASYLCMLC